MEHVTRAEVDQLVTVLADEACTALFEAYGVKLRPVPSDALVDQRAYLSGIVGFSGPGIRGTCILAATERPLLDSNPVGGPPRDWIAELSNQLVGRIKNKLLQNRVEVYVTTPVVLRGEHFAPVPRMELLPRLFVSEGGTVFLWIELDTDDALRLSREPLPTVNEGEALLF